MSRVYILLLISFFLCLNPKYRKRETIESFFEAEKQHADGTRARVWGTDTLRGRMFVQFVSLCYYEYFSEEIRKVKRLLENEINRGELNSNAQKLTKNCTTGLITHRSICSYSGLIQ